MILVLCFYFTEDERGTTQTDHLLLVLRQLNLLLERYDCIMLKIVTKKYENYSRDEHPYDSLGE